MAEGGNFFDGALSYFTQDVAANYVYVGQTPQGLTIPNISIVGSVLAAIGVTSGARVAASLTNLDFTAGIHRHLTMTKPLWIAAPYCGSATLVAGTKTVTVTGMTSSSVVIVSKKYTGAIIGQLNVLPQTDQFICASSNGADTDSFFYLVLNY